MSISELAILDYENTIPEDKEPKKKKKTSCIDGIYQFPECRKVY